MRKMTSTLLMVFCGALLTSTLLFGQEASVQERIAIGVRAEPMEKQAERLEARSKMAAANLEEDGETASAEAAIRSASKTASYIVDKGLGPLTVQPSDAPKKLAWKCGALSLVRCVRGPGRPFSFRLVQRRGRYTRPNLSLRGPVTLGVSWVRNVVSLALSVQRTRIHPAHGNVLAGSNFRIGIGPALPVIVEENHPVQMVFWPIVDQKMGQAIAFRRRNGKRRVEL